MWTSGTGLVCASAAGALGWLSGWLTLVALGRWNSCRKPIVANSLDGSIWQISYIGTSFVETWHAPAQSRSSAPAEPRRSGGIRCQERAKVVRQHFRLVDRNQRSAVVNPHQAGVLEMHRQPFSVSRRHQLVLTGPDDQHRPPKRALLFGPLKQLLPRRRTAQVLAQIAADCSLMRAMDSSVRSTPSAIGLAWVPKGGSPCDSARSQGAEA